MGIGDRITSFEESNQELVKSVKRSKTKRGIIEALILRTLGLAHNVGLLTIKRIRTLKQKFKSKTPQTPRERYERSLIELNKLLENPSSIHDSMTPEEKELMTWIFGKEDVSKISTGDRNCKSEENKGQSKSTPTSILPTKIEQIKSPEERIDDLVQKLNIDLDFLKKPIVNKILLEMVQKDPALIRISYGDRADKKFLRLVSHGRNYDYEYKQNGYGDRSIRGTDCNIIRIIEDDGTSLTEYQCKFTERYFSARSSVSLYNSDITYYQKQIDYNSEGEIACVKEGSWGVGQMRGRGYYPEKLSEGMPNYRVTHY